MSGSDYEQRATFSMQAHTRLMKLLPKLSAVTDQHRLKVLSEIDRVLAAEGLTWADIAEALNEPQGEDLAAAEALALIERIEQEHTVLLTNNARSFLDQLRERAMENYSVHFSFRQGQWLYALQEQAHGRKVGCAGQAPRTHNEGRRPQQAMVTMG
jgi:DNA-binding transcriptional MerR regulator